MAAKNPHTSPATTIPEWDKWVADHPPISIYAPDGTAFEIPAPELVPDDVTELFINEKPIDAIRNLLGTDYPKWTKAGGNVAWFFAQYEGTVGVSVGESVASTGS